ALDDILATTRTRVEQIRPEGRAKLVALLREGSEKTRALLAQINETTCADRDLDVEIAEWAGMSSRHGVPPYTGSLTVATTLVRDRLDHPSLTIHQSIKGYFRIELAAQPVAMS